MSHADFYCDKLGIGHLLVLMLLEHGHGTPFLRQVQLRQARTRSLVYLEAGEALNGAAADIGHHHVFGAGGGAYCHISRIFEASVHISLYRRRSLRLNYIYHFHLYSSVHQ